MLEMENDSRPLSELAAIVLTHVSYRNEQDQLTNTDRAAVTNIYHDGHYVTRFSTGAPFHGHSYLVLAQIIEIVIDKMKSITPDGVVQSSSHIAPKYKSDVETGAWLRALTLAPAPPLG